MRTTSSIEAYNRVLGDNILSRAQFYRFVLALRCEEYKTSQSMEKFIDSGGLRRKCAQKPEFKVRISFFSFSSLFLLFVFILSKKIERMFVILFYLKEIEHMFVIFITDSERENL